MKKTFFSSILLRNIKHLYAEIIQITQLFQRIRQNNLQTCLDIGTGNGMSAYILRKSTGLQVQGLDIGDFRWPEYTTVPLDIYKGKTFPYKDKIYDVSLIAFVLHHSQDAALLLSETRRVTKHYIILLEEVVSNPFHNILMILYDKMINLLIFQEFISTPRFCSEAQLENLIQNQQLKITYKYMFQRKGIVQRVCYLLKPADLDSK